MSDPIQPRELWGIWLPGPSEWARNGLAAIVAFTDRVYADELCANLNRQKQRGGWSKGSDYIVAPLTPTLKQVDILEELVNSLMRTHPEFEADEDDDSEYDETNVLLDPVPPPSVIEHEQPRRPL